MKKIWGYIAALLAGFSAGLIAMYKLMGEQIKIEIKRIKNKRVGESNTSIPIDLSNRENKRLSKRQKRKKKKQ